MIIYIDAQDSSFEKIINQYMIVKLSIDSKKIVSMSNDIEKTIKNLIKKAKVFDVSW